MTRVLFVCVMAGGAGLVFFEHPLSGDDIAHYMMARYTSEHPILVLDIWGRPGFTVLHWLPAQLGWFATRGFTLLLATLCAFFTGRCLGTGRDAALAAGFTFFQTWFFHLSFGTLTETVYALFLSMGLLLLVRGRTGWAALAISWTAITRIEGMPLLAVFGLWLIFRRHGRTSVRVLVRDLLLLGTFPVLWNIALIATGSDPPLPLLARNHFLHSAAETYGSGNIARFVLFSWEIHGPFVLLLAVVGMRALFRDGRGLVPAFIIVFYLLQSILWGFGLFGTAGYHRFFASIAPAVGLAAARGAAVLSARWTEPGWWRGSRLGTILLAGSVVWCIVHAVVFRHLQDQTMDSIARASEVVRGLREERAEPWLIASSSYLDYRLGIDPWGDSRVRPFTREAISAAPPGTIVVYIGGPPNDHDAVPIQFFFADEEARRVDSLRRDGRNYVHLFEKTREGFTLIRDLSIYTRLGSSPEDEPWPYFILIFEKN